MNGYEINKQTNRETITTVGNPILIPLEFENREFHIQDLVP